MPAPPASLRQRLGLDNFTLLLTAVVGLASVLPATGAAARVVEWATLLVVSLLFFLHGAKLSRAAIRAGLMHWRLHLAIFAATFVLFPLLGWGLRPVLEPLITPDMYMGVLFLCALPATVQSAIAFTALARGNMAAAVCSASASTLVGIFVTPVLVGLLLDKSASSGNVWEAIGKITLQLLLPFVLGHLLRPRLMDVLQRRGQYLRVVDQGSILLVVYAAFSTAVAEGLWRNTPLHALLGLLLLSGILLALVLGLTTWSARLLGFDKEDEIVLVFCGSKKSLMSGVPMAKVLFAASSVGAVVLPVMVFHQLQLMVCAVLAQRYGHRRPAGTRA